MNGIEPDRFAEWLGIQTTHGRCHLADQLGHWSDSATILAEKTKKFTRLQRAFQKDPSFFPACQTVFSEVKEIEEKLAPLLAGPSQVEQESYNELLFLKPLLQPLNFVPFVLALWSLFRVYLLPGMSLLVPILTLLAPYFILTFLFHLPLTFQNYMNILHSMITGQLDPSSPSSVPSSLSLKHIGMIGATLIQGVIQPYWTYQHLYTMDSLIQEHGQLAQRLHTLYDTLSDHLSQRGITFFRCPLPDVSDKRQATAALLLHAPYFQLALKYMGSLEALVCLAHHPDLKPVQWISATHPVFQVKGAFDYQVPANERKPIHASFSTRRHSLLTGPNKGGKSTALRAFSSTALLAHTFGCSFGHSRMTPFHRMFLCLKPDDLPGSLSRFEREIVFTAQTLRQRNPILIFMDELYHSTNPPDALRSCEIYSRQLWAMPNVVSVISTHLFEWVRNAPPTIQRLCCPATQKGNHVIFSYSLEPGICTVSSVDLLLQKNGLSLRPIRRVKTSTKGRDVLPQ